MNLQLRRMPSDAGSPAPWAVLAVCLLLLPASVRSVDEDPDRSVDEAGIRLELAEGRAQLLLPVTNRGAATDARLLIETLTPNGETRLSVERGLVLERGTVPLRVDLPGGLGEPEGTPLNRLLLNRLRFELETSDGWKTDGVRALSVVVGLFELRVTAPWDVPSGSEIAVHVQARRTSSGAPVEGVRIEARVSDPSDGEPVRGLTDAHGETVLRIALSEQSDSDEIEVRVRGQLGRLTTTAVTRIYSWSNLEILITTDKPLYRPGQLLRARLLALRRGEHVVASLPLSLRIRAPDWESVFEKTLTTSQNGIATVEWTIPERAASGRYDIEVSRTDDRGEKLGGHQVNVGRYELPVFRLEAGTEEPFHLPSVPRARVVVVAKALTGEPLQGASVTVRERRSETGVHGETGADGRATLEIDLTQAHEDLWDGQQFRDISYEAHVVDPVSGRSESRRFDVRVTRHPVHIYWYVPGWSTPTGLDLDAFLSTSSADGTPLSCDVRLSGAQEARVRTNRHGLARVRLEHPRGEVDEDATLHIEARAERGRFGFLDEGFHVSAEPSVRLDAAATLLRPGQALRVRVRADPPGRTLVYLRRASDPVAIRQVLADTRGAWVEFPYQEGWTGLLTVAAIRPDDKHDASDSLRVLYPGVPLPELTLEARPERARPGERVRAYLQLSDPQGRPLAGTVGLVGVDQALLDRARSEDEFGGFWFGGLSRDDGTVSLDDLRRLDPGRPWHPDLELAAAWLLRPSHTALRSSRSQGPDTGGAYGPVIEAALGPLRELLDDTYFPDPGYPQDLERALEVPASRGAAPRDLADPWGRAYGFRLEPGREHMQLTADSAGPDELLDTRDDIEVVIRSWPLYARLATKLRRALQRYVHSQGSMPPDVQALSADLGWAGVESTSLRDVHGEPLELRLRHEGRHGVIAGFSRDEVVTARVNLFEEAERRLRPALAAFGIRVGGLPRDETEFHEALSQAGLDLSSMRDPWGHQCRPVFRVESRYSDRLRLRAGNDDETRSRVTPVSQDVEAIDVMGAGPDGQPRTGDDVRLATFSRVAEELTPITARRRRSAVVTETAGAIVGQVTDSSGVALPGAAVTAVEIDGSLEIEAATDGHGEYVLGDLPEGVYDVRVALMGFRAAETQVRVTAGQVVAVDVELEVGALTETFALAEPLVTPAAMTAQDSELSHARRRLATPRLREYFPETLVWEPELEIGPGGEAEVAFPLADSLTTWKLTALASTLDGLVATGESEVVGFLPFFGDLDPPPVLTAGDRVDLPVVVHNQLETAERAQVSLEAGEGLRVGSGESRTLLVPAAGTAVATFPLHAESMARDASLTASVIAEETGDRVRKRVQVRPDGEPVERVQADLLSGDASLSFDVPPEALPGTAWGELRLLPQLRWQIIEAIEGALRRPYGCAERTISSAFPSLLFLELAGPEAEAPQVERAERYVKRAVERLRGDQRADGGFGYWRSGQADNAVTAHALRFLVRAQEVVEVPRALPEGAEGFLLDRQTREGRWGESPLCTALVARALAESSLLSRGDRREAALSRAREALRVEAAGAEEPYLLATLALIGQELGDGDATMAALTRLRALERRERDGSYWDLQANTPFFGWGRAGRLETTGLVAQALARSTEADDGALARRALLFLLRGQDAYGVWWSSQATVNVLEALAARARGEPATPPPARPVKVLLDGNEVASFEWSHDDSSPTLFTSLGALSAGPHRVELRGLPAGSNIVRLVTGQARPWSVAPDASPSGRLELTVRHDRTDLQRLGQVTTHVEARRVGFRGYGMMLAEVGLPPGADVDRSSLEDQLWRNGLSRYEIQSDRVILYLWPTGGRSRLDFRFRPRLALDALSAPSRLYDYHNPEEVVRLPPTRFRVRPLAPGGDPEAVRRPPWTATPAR